MKAHRPLQVLLVATGLQLGLAGWTPALALPSQDAQLAQAQQAMAAQDYYRATRILTALAAQKDNPNAERARELLGNAREAAGQLAQAKAEYLAYLKAYPDGEGAGRVRARLQAILGSAPAGGGDGSGVTDRGVVSLTYRFNHTASSVTDLVPTTTERDDTDNAVIAGLRFTRTIATGDRTVRLSFNGLAMTDFNAPGSSLSPLRLSEALISVDNTHSGLVLTFGRQKLTPQGMGERTDGLTLSWPTAGGTVLGAVVGLSVDSTSDAFFGGDQLVLGASATFQDIGAPGAKLSVYYVGQTKGGELYRSAIGAEYALSTASASVSANIDYDLRFAAVNRAAVYGTWTLDDASRLTGRLSYYHGPGLNLDNALIGQGVTDLDLIAGGPYTDAQLTQIAADRSAATTVAGLTYFRKLNPTWDMTLDGTLWETGSMPASAGIDPVAGSGLGTAIGVGFLGSSVFKPGDSLNLGLRYSAVGDTSLVTADAGMRWSLSDAFSLQPRVMVGLRDYGASGSETFVIPSVNGSYRIDRATSLQFQVGGQWAHGNVDSNVSNGSGVFFSAGISRSF